MMWLVHSPRFVRFRTPPTVRTMLSLVKPLMYLPQNFLISPSRNPAIIVVADWLNNDYCHPCTQYQCKMLCARFGSYSNAYSRTIYLLLISMPLVSLLRANLLLTVETVPCGTYTYTYTYVLKAHTTYCQPSSLLLKL